MSDPAPGRGRGARDGWRPMIYALYARIRRTPGHTRQPLTDEQTHGAACTKCGETFTPAQIEGGHRQPDTARDRRGMYTCVTSCILVTVQDTIDLFRATVPGSCMWHLGSDGFDWEGGGDLDELARLDAEPKRTVAITHGGGVLTTRPIPESHAEQIVDQALRLGFTAIAAPVEATR